MTQSRMRALDPGPRTQDKVLGTQDPEPWMQDFKTHNPGCRTHNP